MSWLDIFKRKPAAHLHPTTEPGTDPIRVSLTLQFTTTTKEHR